MKRTLPVLLCIAGCGFASSGVVTTSATGGAGSGTPTVSAPSTATLGQSIVLKGEDTGEQATVTFTKWVNDATPADQYNRPGHGKRWVAAQFQVLDSGSTDYDDTPSNGAEVVDSKGQQYDADYGDDIHGGAAFPSEVKFPPGASRLGFVVFVIPKAARIVQVQFSTDSGFGQTGEWSLSP